MTNEELWDSYSNFSKDLSDNARKLAFAGGAIAWLFKNPKTAESLFPQSVKYALFAIILFFIFDILQYFTGALFVKLWTEHYEAICLEKYGSIKGDYKKAKWLDYPPFGCWVLKIGALLTGYVFLGKQVFL